MADRADHHITFHLVGGKTVTADPLPLTGVIEILATHDRGAATAVVASGTSVAVVRWANVTHVSVRTDGGRRPSLALTTGP